MRWIMCRGSPVTHIDHSRFQRSIPKLGLLNIRLQGGTGEWEDRIVRTVQQSYTCRE